MWLKKLIAAFIKQNGRKPNAIETLQLKFRASDLEGKGQILKPNFGKTPLREFTRKENVYEGMIDPKSDTGKKLSKIRTTMGLPKALRNVKNPKEVKKLLESGDITIGTAPKTTKIKDPVDPKFKRAVESQDEQARLVREFEQRNKDSAFNFAFKKYKDIDRKPMELDEVISIYTNLNKYPKGRSIIFGDIAEIQRRHMLPNIGNRSRDMLINKLNKMVVTKKQPNPFKKAPDEVSEQIEMDFTDWDPKGMAAGGLAYMLGEPSRTPYKRGGRGRQDRMGGTMDQTAAELRAANPAEFAGGMNISHGGGGNNKPTRDEGDNNQSWYQHPVAKAASFMLNPVGAIVGGGVKSLYDDYMRDKALGTNITDAALGGSQYFGPTTSKMQRDYRKTTGLRTPDPTPTGGENDKPIPWWLKKPQQSSLGLEAIKPKDDFDLHGVVEGRIPSRFYAADGGRIGFDKGGYNKGRRNFLKFMAGLASLPIVGKLFKPLKALKTAKTIKLAPATGMPEWFPSLVNKVIKEGDDVTKKFGTIERETVHTKKLGETEAVTVYNNIDNGYIRVEYGGPEFDKTGKIIRASNDPEVVHLEYISPKVIEEGKYKGKKTDAEFGAAESEPEVVNWDGDIEWSGIHEVNKVEDLTTDVSKLKHYATGKNPTIKEILDTSKKKTYRQNLETDTMEQVEYIENKGGYQSIDDVLDEGKRVGDFDPKGYDPTNEFRGINLPEKIKKAKGGLAHMLGE